MRILFDTNIVLDLLLAREPYDVPAARLFTLADDGLIEACVCATTVTAVDYVASKNVGTRSAQSLIRSMLDFVSIAAVDEGVIRRALDARSSDFEDAVVLEAARAVGADGVVTRDTRGFDDPLIPAWLPDELLAMIDVLGDHIEVVSV
ncbi:MAG: type II toxin-antitoxin system VapC family toxin [Coriobacteriia bacterium]